MDDRVRPDAISFTLHARDIVAAGPYGEPLCCQVSSYRGFLLASNSFGSTIYDPERGQPIMMEGKFVIFPSDKQAHAFIDMMLADRPCRDP